MSTFTRVFLVLLVCLPTISFAQTSLQERFEKRRQILYAQDNQAVFAYFDQIVSIRILETGANGSIVLPSDFRFTRYGTYFVQLSNGMSCKITTQPPLPGGYPSPDLAVQCY